MCTRKYVPTKGMKLNGINAAEIAIRQNALAAIYTRSDLKGEICGLALGLFYYLLFADRRTEIQTTKALSSRHTALFLITGFMVSILCEGKLIDVTAAHATQAETPVAPPFAFSHESSFGAAEATILRRRTAVRGR